MTNWYAVAIGFVVMTVVGVVGIAIPGLGQLTAGLVGGFLAGYMAAGGTGRGAWHGLLAGSLGGVFVAVFLGVAVSVLGVAEFGPFGSLLGGGAFLVVLFVTFVMGLESALAGAIGGWIAKE
ncbi:DUF5518 domain-containing protein [Halorussus pelagicus]|uniref:DUF5518 domain-containing protein n=1 Tax=Halorussus pelagicus TaxID=2505977 RepID=UPI000FFC8325|nr:DUF5518 domain-containing protein [Halorussus pelagicus]